MNFSRKFKKLLKIVFILLLLSIGLFFSKEFLSNYFVRINLNTLEAPDKNSRVLVFSPHNDDETLGCAELIKKTIKNGGQVKVVLITNGDGFKNAIQLDYLNVNPKPKDYVNFGYTRQQESINALGKLGLSKEHIIFLGYPDGGISSLWNSNWDNTSAYRSSYTQTDKTPYNNSLTKGVAFTGENLVFDITKTIEDYKPTYIVMPHPNDNHPDHLATNAFVKYSLEKLNYNPEKQLLYLVHRFDWPTPMKKNTTMYLVPPSKLINTGTTWYSLNLTKIDMDEKVSTIHLYKTQLRTLGILMSAFERKNELFGEYDDLTLVSNRKEDKDVSPDNSNKVITDPLKDSLTLEITRNADIYKIYAEASKTNNLHLFLQTDGDIDEDTTYNINLIFFNGNKISRLNLEQLNSKLISKQVSKESLMNIKGVTTKTKGKTIHIIIPPSVFGDYKSIFINSTTFIKSREIDKTAWRMLRNY
jgi:LmbE family N-acetylglucosaminyl deacetylase